MSFVKERRMHKYFKIILQALNLPFKDNGSATAWTEAVFMALYDFHEGLSLSRREHLYITNAEKLSHEFLKRRGENLFGETSEYQGADSTVPIFHAQDLETDKARVNKAFKPIQRALAYQSGIFRLMKRRKDQRIERTSNKWKQIRGSFVEIRIPESTRSMVFDTEADMTVGHTRSSDDSRDISQSRSNVIDGMLESSPLSLKPGSLERDRKVGCQSFPFPSIRSSNGGTTEPSVSSKSRRSKRVRQGRYSSSGRKSHQPEQNSQESPHNQPIKRQSSSTQRIITKTTDRQAILVPCILDDDFMWVEWPCGKISHLDVHGLFMRVAESYEIKDTSSFEEVQFTLMDLSPEKTLNVRRDDAGGFEQSMAQIEEEFDLFKWRPGDHSRFWIGMQPVVETGGELVLNM